MNRTNAGKLLGTVVKYDNPLMKDVLYVLIHKHASSNFVLPKERKSVEFRGFYRVV